LSLGQRSGEGEGKLVLLGGYRRRGDLVIQAEDPKDFRGPKRDRSGSGV
jgi:hypothetical protein